MDNTPNKTTPEVDSAKTAASTPVVESATAPVQPVAEPKVEAVSTTPVASKSNGLVIGVVVAVVVGLVAIVGAIVGITNYAANSNKQVPVFSGLANTIEKQQWNSSENYRKDAAADMFAEIAEPLKELEGKEVTYDMINEVFADADMNLPVSFDEMSYKYDMEMVVKDTTMEMVVNASGFASTADGSDLSEAEVSMEMGDGTTTYNGAAEFKMIDTMLYLKVDSLPELGLGVEDMMGKWYFFDAEEYIDEYSDSSSQTMELEQKDIDALEAVFTHPDFYNSIELLDDRTFDGVVTKCFEVTLDEKKLSNLGEAYAEAYGDDSYNPAASTEEFDLVIQYCADRAEDRPYFMSMEMSDASDMEMSLEMNIFDYGVEVDVEAPKDAEDMMDAIQEVYNSLMPSYDDSYDYDYSDEYDYEYDYDFDY